MLISRRHGAFVRQMSRTLGLTIALLGGAIAAQADFVVDGIATATPNGFQYLLNVTNNGTTGIALISLYQNGILATADSTSAPSGFQISNSSDGVTGFIDLSGALGADSVFGAGQTISGFSFRSDILLIPGLQFSALDVEGGAPNGIANITVAAPEPGSFALIAPLVAGMMLLARRRCV